jgi:hypothetical protein
MVGIRFTHRYAAPFKRGEATLDTPPIWVVAFPGPGMVENFADKARRMDLSPPTVMNRALDHQSSRVRRSRQAFGKVGVLRDAKVVIIGPHHLPVSFQFNHSPRALFPKGTQKKLDCQLALGDARDSSSQAMCWRWPTDESPWRGAITVC